MPHAAEREFAPTKSVAPDATKAPASTETLYVCPGMRFPGVRVALVFWVNTTTLAEAVANLQGAKSEAALARAKQSPVVMVLAVSVEYDAGVKVTCERTRSAHALLDKRNDKAASQRRESSRPGWPLFVKAPSQESEHTIYVPKYVRPL